MKKIILIQCLIGLLSCTSTSQSEQQVQNNPQLKMLVTHYYTIKIEDNQAVRDSVKECFSCNQALVYDTNGREIALRFYKSDMEEVYGYEIYDYDSEGRKIGSSYYENDTIVTKYKYELDPEGRIAIGKAFDLSGKMLYGYLNEYDSLGNHISVGSMDENGEVYEYYKRNFNANRIPITENIVDLDDNPTFRVKYEYRPSADSLWEEQLTFYNDKLSEIRFRERIYFE